MNKKALSLAICAALALPTVTGALTLGEIESNSHLNQPFRGKISLHSTNIAEAKTLRVRIAPEAVFNRVGIDRPRFLNGLRFKTTVQNGKPVILVSSNYPINEPFLNFLLEISWPNGKLLKEYTVLLDPPVLMTPNTAIASHTAGVRPEPQGRVNPAQADNKKLYRDAQRALQQPRRVVRASQNQRSTARRVRPQVRRVAASQVRTYRVKRGDTLHKIAKRIGYRGVSTDQMMLALFEKNKRAFINNNMNNLKAGVVLQRPTAAHAKTVSRSEARKARIAQARAWKQSKAKAVAKTTATKATKKVAKNTQAHIEVSGKTQVSDKAMAVAASGKASVDELRKQLVATSEALQGRIKENQELKSRVSEMESLLRKKNRLISMKSQQLAKLQQSLSGEPVKDKEGADIEATVAGQVKAEAAGTIVRPNDAAKDAKKEAKDVVKAVEEKAQASEVSAKQKAEAAKAKAKTATQEKPKQPQTTAEESSGSIMDTVMGLMDSPDALKYGAGGGAALALLGGLWFMRRRNAYKEFSAEDYIEEGYPEEDSTELFTDKTVMEELNSELASNEADMADMDADVKKEVAENSEDDLLQEADVYIVYGLYEQAETELKEAIKQSPNNLAYRKKLLESYKASGDKSAFEKEAKIFNELDIAGKDEHWEEISEWGRTLVPDSDLFKSPLSAEDSATGVGMVAGTAIPAADNIEDLEDMLGSDESVADEFKNADLDEFLVDDTELSNETAEGIDALDLSDEPDFGDLEDKLASESNELDIDLDTETDSLDSLLDDAIEEPVTAENTDLDLDISLDMDSSFSESQTDDAIAFDSNEDDSLDLLDINDEVSEETEIGTKIDLAKAYIDMGDIDGARSTLEEVMQDGSEEQKAAAEELLQHTG